MIEETISTRHKLPVGFVVALELAENLIPQDHRPQNQGHLVLRSTTPLHLHLQEKNLVLQVAGV